MKAIDDAYGRLLLDFEEGREAPEVIERDDGYIDATSGPRVYFAAYRDWQPHEKEAMRHVTGRVLDVGAGAGRCALYLQERGQEVVAIDISPGAVEVCRRRGVHDARLMPVTRVSRALGRFDTIVMLGNNLGLLGDERRGRWLLRRFAAVTSPDARVVGSTLDPHGTDDPHHIAYHARNRARGRLPGQIRIRVRSGVVATPWFDYLFVSRDELKGLVEGTGWHVEHFIDSDGPMYTAVLAKAHR